MGNNDQSPQETIALLKTIAVITSERPPARHECDVMKEALCVCLPDAAYCRVCRHCLSFFFPSIQICQIFYVSKGETEVQKLIHICWVSCFFIHVLSIFHFILSLRLGLYVAENGPQLTIFSPGPPECWGCKPVPPCYPVPVPPLSAVLLINSTCGLRVVCYIVLTTVLLMARPGVQSRPRSLPRVSCKLDKAY